MPRKLRIEYEGAIYHVLNRGNYRRDVFETAGAAEAFVTALAEATSRYKWKVHAYVVMRNHYHVALETPQPNLVDGMHWLQSTLAIRFNRLRGERGHLFQGRYQSLLVENQAALSRLVDYIHLNPVRAGIVTTLQVESFRWSSLSAFAKVKTKRFAGLLADDWLKWRGWVDNDEGWHAYLGYLRALADDAAEQKRLGFGSMSKGWTLGTEGWRKTMAKEHAQRSLTTGIDAEQARHFKEAIWAERLMQLLQGAGKQLPDLTAAKKNAPWKLAIALQLRRGEGASSSWLARTLHMGTLGTTRSYLSKANHKIDKTRPDPFYGKGSLKI